MKFRRRVCLLTAALLLFSGCGRQNAESTEAAASEPEETQMVLVVNGTEVTVQWERNQAVEELLALAQDKTVAVPTTLYGGFEQVGPLPQSFSREDTQMTTEPGDIVLYSGNQLVVFFGANSWSYTKLGHIDLPADTLATLLSGDSALLELRANG